MDWIATLLIYLAEADHKGQNSEADAVIETILPFGGWQNRKKSSSGCLRHEYMNSAHTWNE